MTVTVVSAFYLFPKSKHTPESYKKWLANFLRIRTRVVLFTNQHTKDEFFRCENEMERGDGDQRLKVPGNMTIVICEVSEFLVGKYDWVKQRELDLETCNNPDLYMVWNEKVNFVKKVIISDRDTNMTRATEYYYWVDSGCFRDEHSMELYVDWPSIQMCRAIGSKIALMNVKVNEAKNPPIIAGGYFGGSVTACLKWHDSYYQTLDSFISKGIFAGKEQEIMPHAYLRFKDDVHLISSVHDRSYRGDEWFYPHPYLCGLCQGAQTLLRKVTVLIPIYNGIEYLRECLGSVFSQTYTNYEVLIGINGHTDSVVYDEAVRVATEFSTSLGKGERRVNVKNYTTKGKPDTLMAMKDDVVGEFICILDVDDKWAPDKLAAQMQYIDGYDVVGSPCHYFGERELVLKLPTGDISNADFFAFNHIVNSSVLLRKYDLLYSTEENPTLKQLESIGAEDYSLWLRLRKMGKKFYNIPEPLVYHRIHRDSFFNPRVSGTHIQTIKDVVASGNY